MWDIDVSKDLVTFLLSLALGAIFSLFYDIFIALHKTVFKSVFSVILTDLSYFIIISLATFMFCIIRSLGYIRAYILLGILIGFLILHFSLSKYISHFFEVVIRLILKVFCKLSSVLRRFFEWLLCKFKKITLFFKNRLQMLVALLYNHFKSKRIG